MAPKYNDGGGITDDINSAPLSKQHTADFAYACAQRFPEFKGNPQLFSTMYLTTIHRVVMLSVNSADKFDPRELFNPRASDALSTVIKRTEESPNPPPGVDDPDIFAPRGDNTHGAVRILYDKMFTTTPDQPFLPVKFTSQLKGARFAYDNDVRDHKECCVGRHIAVVYCMYVPDLPTSLSRNRAAFRSGDFRRVIYRAGADEFYCPDINFYSAMDGRVQPYLPNLIPGRFRFTSNFVYDD